MVSSVCVSSESALVHTTAVIAYKSLHAVVMAVARTMLVMLPAVLRRHMQPTQHTIKFAVNTAGRVTAVAFWFQLHLTPQGMGAGPALGAGDHAEAGAGGQSPRETPSQHGPAPAASTTAANSSDKHDWATPPPSPPVVLDTSPLTSSPGPGPGPRTWQVGLTQEQQHTGMIQTSIH
jgi:hypothetical protein